ncbi:O-antigen ligase family protein [Holdemanella porci]|uniref:O-antigen ligase family protein n=1 Tax=Holdemanella porci TaxID=2652276 RepID=UPI003890F03A
MYIFNNVNIYITVLILAITYIPSTLNIVLLGALFALLFYKNRKKFVLNMPGENLCVLLFIIGITIGFFGIFTKSTSLYELIKHIYLFLFPFLYWHIGNYLVKTSLITKKSFLNTLVFNAVLISSIDIIMAVFKICTNNAYSINQFRELIGTGNILSLIGIYILFVYKNNLYFTRKQNAIVVSICLLSSIIHFSRMTILYAIIFLLFSNFNPFSKKGKRCILIGVCLILLLTLIFPNIMGSYISKIFSTLKEINFNKSDWNETTIVLNWRGYEVYCALDQFKGFSIFKKIFGNGFGTMIDAKGYAYLVSQKDYLSFLHNGYFTQLLIWGVFGWVIFALWMYRFLKTSISISSKNDRNFSMILILIIIVANFFVMGPFFSQTIASLFLYISVLFSLNKKRHIRRKDSCVNTN